MKLLLSILFSFQCLAMAQEVSVSFSSDPLLIPVPQPGTGIGGAPKATPASASYGTEFPVTAQGQSITHTFVITNISGSKRTFDFTLANNHPSFSLSQSRKILVDGEATTLGVTFSPSNDKRFTDTIQIISTAAPSEGFIFAVKGATPFRAVTLENSNGELIEGDNIPSVEAGTSFSQLRDGENITREFTLTNTGTIDFSYQIEFAEQGELFLRNPSEPVGVLVPGESTTFSVRFIPRITGIRNDSLVFRFSSDGNDSSASINFRSEVLERPEAGFLLVPEEGEPYALTAITTFPDTNPRDRSEAIRVRVTNMGNVLMEEITIASNDTEFLVEGEVPQSLAPGASFDLEVIFNPQVFVLFGSALNHLRDGTILLDYANRQAGSPSGVGFRGRVVGGKLSAVGGQKILAAVNQVQTFTIELQNSPAATADLELTDIIFPESTHYTFSYAELPPPIPAGESGFVEVTYLATIVHGELSPSPVIQLIHDGESGTFALNGITIQTIDSLNESFQSVTYDPQGPNIELHAPPTGSVANTTVYYLSESLDLKTWTRKGRIFRQPNHKTIHTVNLTEQAPSSAYYRIEISRLGYP